MLCLRLPWDLLLSLRISKRIKNINLEMLPSRHGDHTTACINVQSSSDRTNPSVLCLKYKLNIKIPAHSRFNFYNFNGDHDSFFNSRIRSLL